MLETKNITLTALSPIHIKGREVDYGCGMVKANNNDTHAYVVEQEKLIALLSEHNLVNVFVNEFSDPACFRGRRGSSPLGEFLSRYRLLTKGNLKRISSGVVVSRPNRYFLRNGNDQVIIPGSSIKGALRTAVAYHMLGELKNQNAAQFQSTVVSQVQRGINRLQTVRNPRERDKQGETVSKEIMYQLFGSEPHYDLLRAIKVFDAFPDNEPRMETVKLLCVDGHAKRAYFGSRQRMVTLTCECLSESTTASFQLTLDHNVLKERAEDLRIMKLPFSSIAELLQVARSFAAEQWKFEQTFLSGVQSGVPMDSLRRFYEEDGEASLRIGWGTGMLGTTIDLLFDDSLRQQIRDVTMRRPGDPAPKSRRIVTRNGIPLLPLGWVKLTM